MKAFPLLSRSLGSLFTPDLISRPTLTKSLDNLRRYSSSIDLAGAVSDPLRILFCGSDTFSCASLRALHSEHARNSKLVEALEVMVLPPRRTGRGLKQLREVPCRAVAEELGLRVHQRETFRKWDLPDGTNLVVVVSFGLFVPARILRSAKYGGVNVHPSLLPDLRGPAPIHHAMLRGDSHVGISLQTLDDKAFDHGTVLAQTPAPGLPIHPGASLHEVIDDAAAAGAEMLVQGLRNGLHIPPHQSVAGRSIPGLPLTHAPKVTKADSEVDWDAWASVGDFARRIRVFSSVWTRTVLADGHAEKRLLFLDAEEVTEATAAGEEYSIAFAHGDGRRTQRTGQVFARHMPSQPAPSAETSYDVGIAAAAAAAALTDPYRPATSPARPASHSLPPSPTSPSKAIALIPVVVFRSAALIKPLAIDMSCDDLSLILAAGRG
ncbi:hypothetical protein DCS_02949 [Drechmeria coniospora]|uniref:methionyl-tRNA formyltransferase n=1 Tax=Drechmeria coniospora TaxID=98403 RepID=A0A151GXG9_DRECN|nr:hypothetical protein DCS_02949 [Drechmeria coniospora]KYK61805.1 hypothetical protein DCS_02949 [Drechmeria coniospora]